MKKSIFLFFFKGASKQGSKIQEIPNQNVSGNDPTQKIQPAGRGNANKTNVPEVNSQPANGNEVMGEQPPLSSRRSYREDPEIAKERKNYDREELEQKMKRTSRLIKYIMHLFI